MSESDPQSRSTEESRLLALLKDVQKVLADSLNSLEGKSIPTPESLYLSWAAAFVNKSADGYLLLRESGRVDSAKLLIRPALEATFAGKAITEKPGFLFRKAYTEWLEDKKLFANEAAAEAQANLALDNLEKAFKTKLPSHPIERKRVNVRETADAAGVSENYEAYKVYCQFTHGAMRVVFGNLDRQTDVIDTKTMIWCVLMILDQLKKQSPAQIPDLTEFKKRIVG